MRKVLGHWSFHCLHSILSCNWLSFVLRIYTSWLEKEFSVIVTKADTNAFLILAIAKMKIDFHETGPPRFFRQKNFLISPNKRQQRGHPTRTTNRLTRAGPKQQATPAVACTTNIRTHSWRRNRQIGKTHSKEFNVNLDLIVGINWWKVQLQYKHFESCQITTIWRNRHNCGVYD